MEKRRKINFEMIKHRNRNISKKVVSSVNGGFDEHVFKLNSTTSTIKYWECTFDECSARIHTHSNGQNMCIQFNAGLGVIIKQIKTIPIQRHISNLDKRYYYGAINAMEYLDNLSFTVSQRKHENL
ncbi:unnamed protein product [Rotaria sordida]|uniref:FLYWCH-type domain-containing protein n=1 Tax=Rotaria sordida TaxID=392033 RepID=A0A818YB04_9BILA|nr:unnamed protein product [Rotaria sordida]